MPRASLRGLIHIRKEAAREGILESCDLASSKFFRFCIETLLVTCPAMTSPPQPLSPSAQPRIPLDLSAPATQKLQGMGTIKRM